MNILTWNWIEGFVYLNLCCQCNWLEIEYWNTTCSCLPDKSAGALTSTWSPQGEQVGVGDAQSIKLTKEGVLNDSQNILIF